jgi:FkbM family methyltransferase
MKSLLLPMLALPYARLELPGWGRVLRATGVFANDRWAGAPTRRIRGKLHGYEMTLDLANWSERHTYFLGRFYDLEMQQFIQQFVRPGDTFIDVGSNVGMIALLAARCVGPTGRVLAFEPNPVAYQRLRETLDANGLEFVKTEQCGLSDAPGELTLNVLKGHTGMGTMARPHDADQQHVTARHVVRVARGDDVLPADLSGPAMLKIDVEGFECHVLRGLPRTLSRVRPVVLAEALPGHLERAGASLKEMLDLLEGHGYRTYDIGMTRVRLRYRLSLSPLAPGARPEGTDLVFVHPDSPHGQRLEAWQRKAAV